MSQIMFGMYPRKCKTCGKEFEARREYGWKIPQYRSSEFFYYFCSYSCMRAYETAKEEKKKPKETVRVLGLIRAGYSKTETGRIVGMTYKQVKRIWDRWGQDVKEVKIG